MEKEYDIVAMGELLIDFTPAGVSETGMCLYERNPGGAPVNMLTAAAKAGLRTAFIGKVGNDMHGKFLIEAVENQNINSDGIILDDNVFTTLAFVNLTKDGERSFGTRKSILKFYRIQKFFMWVHSLLLMNLHVPQHSRQ